MCYNSSKSQMRCTMKKTLSIILFYAILLVPYAHAQQFIVRTVYFQPTDAPAPVNKEIISLLVESQDFYRNEMERYGYGPKTFTLETTPEGHVGFHIIKGKHKSDHYLADTYNQLVAELPFDFRRQSLIGQNNIHLIIVAGLDNIDLVKLGSGFPYSQFHSGGTALVPGNIAEKWIIAHELGHAFGLFHTGQINALMSIRGKNDVLPYEARWLANHHAFRNTHTKTDVPQNFIDLPIKAIGGGTIRFKIIAESKSGLYHAPLCRKRGTYILGYDDGITGNSDVIEIDASRGRLINGDNGWFQVMDINGNYTFHHLPSILLPDINTEKPINKNPEPEICADCLPENIDTPINKTDLSIQPTQLLTIQWAILKKP